MKKFLGFCLVALLSFGGLSGLSAQDATLADDSNAAVSVVTDEIAAPASTKKGLEFKGKDSKLEQIKTSGVIQVTPADPAKNQKYSTIILVCGEKQYKLLPGQDRVAFAKLEDMAGQTITIKGGLMPATEKYPLPAIKVNEIPGVSKTGGENSKGKALGKGKAREKR